MTDKQSVFLFCRKKMAESTTMNITNISTTTWKYQKQFDNLMAYWKIAHWIDFGTRITLVLIGMISCVLGLVAIYRTRMQRAYGFVRLLTSLYISLLMNKCIVMVMDIIRWGHKYHWPMGDVLCRIHGFLTEFFEGGIAYQIIILSVYLLLTLRKSRWVTRLDSRIGSGVFLGVFWTLVFLFNAESLGAHSTKDWGSFTSCWARTRTWRHWDIIAWGYLIFLLYAPWLSVCAVAGYLYYMYRQERGMGYYRANNGSPRQTRDYQRLTMSFAILLTISLGPRAILVTRWLLHYWSFSWNIAFWFVMDLLWFMEDMYTTLVPLFVIIFLPDLNYESKCLVYRVFGKAPPSSQAKMNYKKGEDTEDETNLV